MIYVCLCVCCTGIVDFLSIQMYLILDRSVGINLIDKYDRASICVLTVVSVFVYVHVYWVCIADFISIRIYHFLMVVVVS